MGVLLLTNNIGSLIHGAVRPYSSPNPNSECKSKILESGSANTALTFNASHRQNDWDNFVQGVPECASLVSTGRTFDCLRNASSIEILNGVEDSLALANEQFPWVPTIDGPGGLIPELPSELYAKGAFARIPFIAGTNLDEGLTALFTRRKELTFEGTVFTPLAINSSDMIREWIVTNDTTRFPSNVAALEHAADQILELYPDIPALGSPFNTGNVTFGLSSQFKRLAAISLCLVLLGR